MVDFSINSPYFRKMDSQTRAVHFFIYPGVYSEVSRIDMKASCGIETCPIAFMRFLPSFCRLSTFIFRVTSPPYSLAVTSLRKALIVSRAMILPPIAACSGISN